MGKEGKKGTGDRHFSLRFQIRFVGDDDDREKVFVLHPENLLVESGDFIVRIPRCDTIHTQEPFTCPHILFPHRTVQKGAHQRQSSRTRKKERNADGVPIFFLAGGIQNVQQSDLVVDDTLFSVRVCEGAAEERERRCFISGPI